MTRRQWIGLAGVLFGVALFAGVVTSGTTPDSTGEGAVQRYTDYWSDGDHQDRASLGTIVLTYACVLLVLFTTGLRSLLGDGPLPRVVMTAGAASAALLGAGAALLNGAGIAAAEAGYQPDGNDALLVEGIGYYTVTTAIMLAGAMAVCFSLANREARVVPGWTVVLSGLLGVVALGSIFVAWVGFMLLPLWSVVVGGLLIATKAPVAAPQGDPARV